MLSTCVFVYEARTFSVLRFLLFLRKLKLIKELTNKQIIIVIVIII